MIVNGILKPHLLRCLAGWHKWASQYPLWIESLDHPAHCTHQAQSTIWSLRLFNVVVQIAMPNTMVFIQWLIVMMPILKDSCVYFTHSLAKYELWIKSLGRPNHYAHKVQSHLSTIMVYVLSLRHRLHEILIHSFAPYPCTEFQDHQQVLRMCGVSISNL